MKKREKNKGITIIVLIITIVVMFILAAVSVNLVIKTDIFNSAKGAVKKTNGKIAETETQVNELLNEWERLNAEWGDNTGGENTTPGGNTTPETCSHIWGAWNTTKAATCTAEGSKSRTCSVCKHVETESIAATGHSWNASTGKCNTCGTACTHTYGEWQTTTEATCTAAGSKSRTCSVCKHVETESITATGHSWNASTGKCNTCGTACTHKYGAYTTTTEATCTVAGSKYAECTTCRYKNVQMIPVLGHNYSGGTCTRCGEAEPKPLAVGDYISYTPDTANTAYTKMTSATTGSSSNPSGGIPKDITLTWRVLSINGDGTVDIVSTKPIATSIYFSNAIGYNNGVYLLNDLCKTHYSNSSLGVTARSINLEDIENKMNSTGIAARDAYKSDSNIQYGTTKTYTNIDYTKAPDIYTKVSKDTAGESLDYYTSPTTATYSTLSNLTVKYTYYVFKSTPASYFDDSTFHELIFDTGTSYWLASRCSGCSSTNASFALRCVYNSTYLTGCSLFGSAGGHYTYDGRVRPVVTLTSNIQISTSGGTESSPRTLTKK